MTALEESKIRIKVYKELSKAFNEIFKSSKNSSELEGVFRYLDGCVNIENEITERFKTYGQGSQSKGA